MRTSTLLILSVLLTVSATACDKGGDKKDDKKVAADKKAGDEKKADDVAPPAEGGAPADGGAEAGAPADGGAAAPPTLAEVTLPKAGLKGDAPEGTSVTELMGNDMVQGPNLVVTVEKGDEKPKTGDDAIKDADMYTPKDPKVETIADGYVLTFTNEGGLGTNFWVNARREIGGAAYWCTTTASSQEQSDAAVAFCKSLRK
jgi:hypothetical protein